MVIFDSNIFDSNIFDTGGAGPAPQPKSSGGGTPRDLKRLFKRTEQQLWPVTGKLLMEDNLNLISRLIREETSGLNGFLIQEQITEVVGKLELEDQIKLNSKLIRLEEFKIKEGNSSKYFKILMDILDEL